MVVPNPPPKKRSEGRNPKPKLATYCSFIIHRVTAPISDSAFYRITSTLVFTRHAPTDVTQCHMNAYKVIVDHVPNCDSEALVEIRPAKESTEK